MINTLFNYFKLYDKISRNLRTGKYAPHEPEISNYSFTFYTFYGIY